MKRVITFLLAFMLGFIALSVNAASPSLCVNPYSGDILAKTKCGYGETKLTTSNAKKVLGIETIASQSTHQPFDVSHCRKTESSMYSRDGIAVSTTACSSSEFLMNYSYYVDPITFQYSLSQQMTYRDSQNIPWAIKIQTVKDLMDKLNHLSDGQEYTLHVVATCCPV